MAEPADERLEAALAAELPGTLVHRGDDAVRALVPVARRGADAVAATARALQQELGAGSIGLSSVCSDPAAFVDGLSSAFTRMPAPGADAWAAYSLTLILPTS